jgi:ubiquinone biosynthesis protein COQ9
VAAKTESLDAARDRIALALLRHVPFDGFGPKALAAGAADAGYRPEMALRAFPRGMAEVAEHVSRYADRKMAAELKRRRLDSMRVRDRVATAVRVRVEVLAAHREAVRRLVAFLALPHNAPLAARLTWRTVDAMWHAAGDTSTDYNYYTKRGLLAGVYAATVLCWLADRGDGKGDYPDTWAFLDRRISEVLRVFGLPKRLYERIAGLPWPGRGSRQG